MCEAFVIGFARIASNEQCATMSLIWAVVRSRPGNVVVHGQSAKGVKQNNENVE